MKHLRSIITFLAVVVVIACVYTGNGGVALTLGGLIYLIITAGFMIGGAAGLVVTIWKGPQDKDTTVGEIVGMAITYGIGFAVGVIMLIIALG